MYIHYLKNLTGHRYSTGKITLLGKGASNCLPEVKTSSSWEGQSSIQALALNNIFSISVSLTLII